MMMKIRKKKYLFIFGIACFVLLAAVLVLIYMNKGDDDHMDMDLVVVSTAFENNGMIPAEYTGRGIDISPPLEIKGIGSGGISIAVIMDDPDAPIGTFTHWLIWNIPVKYSMISAGISKEDNVISLGGACQGINDFNKVGYNGPLPPSGTHTYKFKVYVLDIMVDTAPGADKNELLKAMEGHILQYGLLRGKVRR